MLDPFYRTSLGFALLIEKEFLSFGHQFGLRNGVNVKDNAEHESSPVFLQFLDCVFQITNQFPNMFEFNTKFLIFIADHINSGRYGTFLFNNEKERKDFKVKDTTISIWSDMLIEIREEQKNKIICKDEFLNVFFNKQSNEKVEFLMPNFSIYKITLWEDFYLKNIQSCTNLGYYLSEKENEKKVIKTAKEALNEDKCKDQEIIKRQNKKINDVNFILEELISKMKIKKNNFEELSAKTKNYIEKLEIDTFIDEDDYIFVNKNIKNSIYMN